jgi:formylglycine-generating enzyme required for sulfatase activity
MKKIIFIIAILFTQSLVISQQLPKVITTPKDNAEMVLIPEGKFIYGINPGEREIILKQLSTASLDIFMDEFRKQTISLPAYYIDKYEVTNEQYGKFLQETGYKRKPKYWNDRLFRHPKQPVVGIGWADAEAYAKWAGKRLPDEREWEKAARGTKGWLWPWGNTTTGKEYNGKIQGRYAPAVVGSFPSGKSPYGVFDMAGNVYEMTTGIWRKNGKAMRGGCYLNAAAYTRTMFRWAPDDTIDGASWLGFRCVMDPSAIKGMVK